MNEKNDFALVPRPPSAVEKAEPGAKRVLAGMVGDTLALANKAQIKPGEAIFRIGEYEWCEPDYCQILIWAKALNLDPAEVIQRLLVEKDDVRPEWVQTKFADGVLQKLDWNFELLPLRRFEWVRGLAMTHICLSGPMQEPTALALQIPSLTHLRCCTLRLTELELSGVPGLGELVVLTPKRRQHGDAGQIDIDDPVF